MLAPFAPRRCSYTYETTFRVHMAQRGCAAPRIADEPVLVPPRASPRCRSTRPGCENALPDAEKCWSRSHRGGAPTRTKPLRSGCIWRSAGALHPALRTSRCSSLSGHHRAVGAPAPGAKMCWPRSHRGGAPTRTPPGNVEHQLDERIRPDHEAPACTRALPPRQKKSPGCEQPGDCLEPGLDQLRIFSGRIRKRASAGSSHRAPNMFQRNMKVSRIPMSAWNLMSEKIQVATPMARVKPVKVTALPVVFSVS